MGAYSRWALIRGWALIRINTVYNFHHSRAALLRQGLTPRSLPSPECELRAVGEQLLLRQPQGEGDFHHPEEDAVTFLEPLVPGAGGLGFTKALLSISQLSEDTERARFRGQFPPTQTHRDRFRKRDI